ncbi:hypothetical protein PIB30_090524 [Stylosanthes scabra]|uniref:Uncharacterized protein n=1 Tax=Stylosanthes scabra TaxID=79078 RepID=A0ABU6RV10_9FABA|nr:hypothetical protein [Stylosanthes scabra]
MRDKKGKKDKGKLDEPGKKKSVKASGVKTNVSHMEWNHPTNLSELKGQPLKFHDDHSHNKGVYAYLVKDTSKWKSPPPFTADATSDFTINLHIVFHHLSLSHHHPSTFIIVGLCSAFTHALMCHRLAASWCFFYVLSSAPSW